MAKFTDSSFSFCRDGKIHLVKVRHPETNSSRKDAIEYLQAHGCQIIPDVEALPEYLIGLDSEVQGEIVKNRLDLMSIYLVRILSTTTLLSADLRYLKELPELEHLYLSMQLIVPEDLLWLKGLQRLRILTLIGKEINDEHLSKLPRFPKLEMVDIQMTGVTEMGIKNLAKKFPATKICSDFM